MKLNRHLGWRSVSPDPSAASDTWVGAQHLGWCSVSPDPLAAPDTWVGASSRPTPRSRQTVGLASDAWVDAPSLAVPDAWVGAPSRSTPRPHTTLRVCAPSRPTATHDLTPIGCARETSVNNPFTTSQKSQKGSGAPVGFINLGSPMDPLPSKNSAQQMPELFWRLTQVACWPPLDGDSVGMSRGQDRTRRSR